MEKQTKQMEDDLAQLFSLWGDYIDSEGCGCCEDDDHKTIGRKISSILVKYEKEVSR